MVALRSLQLTLTLFVFSFHEVSLKSSIDKKLTCSTPCPCFKPPPFRQDAALTHLYSLANYDLLIWTNDEFPFGKNSSSIFIDFSLCNKYAFSYSIGSVGLSFSTKANAFRSSLGFFSFVFYLTLSRTNDRNFPFSLVSLSNLRYNWSPVTHFFQLITRPINWPDEVHCLRSLVF